MSKSNVSPDTLRITNQYIDRVKGAFYELRCGDAKLALQVVQGRDGGPPEWRVEARTTQTAQQVVIGEWAASRALALEAVGRAWADQAEGLGLPPFEWADVTAALVAVRAV